MSSSISDSTYDSFFDDSAPAEISLWDVKDYFREAALAATGSETLSNDFNSALAHFRDNHDFHIEIEGWKTCPWAGKWPSKDNFSDLNVEYRKRLVEQAQDPVVQILALDRLRVKTDMKDTRIDIIASVKEGKFRIDVDLLQNGPGAYYGDVEPTDFWTERVPNRYMRSRTLGASGGTAPEALEPPKEGKQALNVGNVITAVCENLSPWQGPGP